MSTNSIVSFVLGLVVGAAAALLLAPKSGEDLRADLAREARQDRERLQEEYDRAVSDLHDRLNKAQTDMQSTMEHMKAQAQSATKSAADAVSDKADEVADAAAS